jgi:hypothetical protein
MNETIPVDVAGCPNCGNTALMVPEGYAADTIVTCPKCGYEARWENVFGGEKEI